MAKLTLRPWGYPKNKKMLLYWLCSPYRRNDGRWTVKAVFVSAEEEQGLFEDGFPITYHISEFPWGLLPNLRVGRTYVNGVLETGTTSETKRIYVPNIQDGSICTAFQIPKQLYSFFDNKTLGDEKVWRFKVDSKIYYLPCLEMIRAFFAPSKTLTNQLLKPNGLESLIDYSENLDGELHLTLSSDIPQSIVNDEMVTHLLWITYNETAKTSWQKVYREVFIKANSNFPIKPTSGLAKGLPLETRPPLESQCELIFRFKKVENSCLIYEIVGVNGLPDIPFEKINYKHASFWSKIGKKTGNKQSKKISLLNRDGRYIQSDKRSRVKTLSKQPLAEIPKIVLGFSTLPHITKAAITNSLENEYILNPKNTPKKESKNTERTEVSADESYFGGEVKPIEFAGLKLIEKSEDQGLNDFILTLNWLERLNPKLKIAVQIHSLPGDLPFCFVKGSIKRNFAIATIHSQGIAPIYLLEISRLDNWQISTLLVKFNPQKTDLTETTQILLLILEKMIENNGHWVLESLEHATKFRFKRIKHFHEDSIEAGALAINKQLLFYGFC